MTKTEFSKAFEIARSDMDLSGVEIESFNGFGLYGFQPIATTLQAVARLIRWQCYCLNGSIDSEALNDIRQIGKRKFEIVG
jgi:hypothetical protein